MDLHSAEEGKEYVIESVDVGDDDEMEAFLFSLGCYSGQPITVISHIRAGSIVAIKDGRYTVDKQLMAAIKIK